MEELIMKTEIKTAQELLHFISEYADAHLAEAEAEVNPAKAREKYAEYNGMRDLINAAIDEI